MGRIIETRWPNTIGSREIVARDHARECVVRTGRTSSNLGRQPDPSSIIAHECEEHRNGMDHEEALSPTLADIISPSRQQASFGFEITPTCIWSIYIRYRMFLHTSKTVASRTTRRNILLPQYLVP
jgi:hypothetical protein